MDKATGYLIIKEAKTQKIISSLKLILPNIRSALLKGNVDAMKKIATRLPRKKIKDIERQSIRQIPGFKEKYKEAQMKISRVKSFDSYTAKPAAISVALAAATTNNSVDDIIKKGEMETRNAKILPIPGYFSLIKLGLFVSFIASVYITDGAIIMPTINLAIKSIVSILELLSSIIEGIAASGGDASKTGVAKSALANFWAKSFARPEADPDSVAMVSNFTNQSASDIASVLHKIDPLSIK